MKRSTLLAICLACLLCGYLAASIPGFRPVNPFHPQPDRPVKRLLARLAKLGLWLTVFAEPAPQPVERQYSARHPVHGSLVCHSEGW